MNKDKLVVITVNSGVVHVEESPEDIKVIIIDNDILESYDPQSTIECKICGDTENEFDMFSGLCSDCLKRYPDLVKYAEV